MATSGMLAPEKAPQFLDSMLRRNVVVIISATYCTFCTRLKALFIERKLRFVSLEVDIIPNGRALFQEVQARTSVHTVPQVFVRQKFVGGFDEVMELGKAGELEKLADAAPTKA
jgi:glutaredoxin-related protein